MPCDQTERVARWGHQRDTMGSIDGARQHLETDYGVVSAKPRRNAGTASQVVWPKCRCIHCSVRLAEAAELRAKASYLALFEYRQFENHDPSESETRPLIHRFDCTVPTTISDRVMYRAATAIQGAQSSMATGTTLRRVMSRYRRHRSKLRQRECGCRDGQD